MEALRPVARRLKLRSTAARPSKPLRKHNATAQAVEGNLGGFCVYKSRIEIIRDFSRPTLRFGLSVADALVSISRSPAFVSGGSRLGGCQWVMVGM